MTIGGSSYRILLMRRHLPLSPYASPSVYASIVVTAPHASFFLRTIMFFCVACHCSSPLNILVQCRNGMAPDNHVKENGAKRTYQNGVLWMSGCQTPEGCQNGMGTFEERQGSIDTPFTVPSKVICQYLHYKCFLKSTSHRGPYTSVNHAFNSHTPECVRHLP